MHGKVWIPQQGAMALPASLRNNSAGSVPNHLIYIWILALVIWFQDEHPWAFLDERPEMKQNFYIRTLENAQLFLAHLQKNSRSGLSFGNCVIFFSKSAILCDDDMGTYTKLHFLLGDLLAL
jgi:hypothetical protein